ncbi:ATP-dependent helicase HrpB [Desulfoprunum benzoelyticum]|uniref:ATP-dependent helicase HrpB n=1 Tax=Desulfoprunum benzoelyticum TaxID=1506996 RepID=A0A840UQZ7_9BACT|nr:ATP-dependent helicase HrpB [Desulfoprunum benzoelyticum]MBB5347256.1 ATP-dependent helicase HrpB [Desulfoprunum benzoelyticum]MBM9531390.1 ATP-dependent helicase HrpB [Desulfoprunum benzoelyticum]
MDNATLPIETILTELRETLARRHQVILTAPPGAGKTTRVPLALLDEPWLAGRKIIMLEPRRLAARSAARYMARQLGEEVGRRVGYRVRMDTRVSAATRIEVVTEGILVRMLQHDPELAATGIVIFDEFHERNLDSDLALALCLDLQGALNPELRLLVMSATLPTEQLTAVLADSTSLACGGRQFPVEIRYRGEHTPARNIDQLVREILQAATQEEGSILVFVPGTGEIHQLCRRLTERLPTVSGDKWRITPLFGALTAGEQDLAIAPAPPGKRKIVVATDIAETSLTIEGIRIVIDTGLQRRPYFDPATGLTRLQTMPISQASAIQRSGRAGRMEPGISIRLWGEHATGGLIPSHRPEILGCDLTGLALELAVWGVSDPARLQWLDPPPQERFAAARLLLQQLGALDDTLRVTDHGQRLADLPLHPRLAHMVVLGVEDGTGFNACLLAAVISEKDLLRFDRDHYQADLQLRIDIMEGLLKNGSTRSLPRIHNGMIDTGLARRIATAACDLARRLDTPEKLRDCDYGRLLAWGYPERIGCRRPQSEVNYLLAGGQGAYLDPNDSLSRHEWLAVFSLDGNRNNARIYLALGYDRVTLLDQFADQLQEQEHLAWDGERGLVVAETQTHYQKLLLTSKPLTAPDPEAIQKILLEQIRKSEQSVLPWNRTLRNWQQRVCFAGKFLASDANIPDMSDAQLLAELEEWLAPFLDKVKSAKELAAIDLGGALKTRIPYPLQRQIDTLAPTHYVVPSGSKIPIDYSGDIPVLAVRLQEMFGLDQTPAVANGRQPLLLQLLSPASRPIQITSDLPGFWRSSYEAVKKEMKGRYPKHYWPDDPLAATPANRAKPRKPDS